MNQIPGLSQPSQTEILQVLIPEQTSVKKKTELNPWVNAQVCSDLSVSSRVSKGSPVAGGGRYASGIESVAGVNLGSDFICNFRARRIRTQIT